MLKESPGTNSLKSEDCKIVLGQHLLLVVALSAINVHTLHLKSTIVFFFLKILQYISFLENQK